MGSTSCIISVLTSATMGTLMMVMDAARLASQEFCGDGIVNDNGKSVMTGTQLLTMGTQCVPDLCCDGTTNNAGAEACDDGYSETGDGCSYLCVIEVCGDGIVNNNNNTEECDDGNNATRDGCSLCRVEFCGDGAINNN
eukprot:3874680-Rhodomonas_salina.1